MKQGLAEWAIVTAFLVVVAVAAALLFGEDIRGAFGVRPTTAAARAGGRAP